MKRVGNVVKAKGVIGKVYISNGIDVCSDTVDSDNKVPEAVPSAVPLADPLAIPPAGNVEAENNVLADVEAANDAATTLVNLNLSLEIEDTMSDHQKSLQEHEKDEVVLRTSETTNQIENKASLEKGELEKNTSNSLYHSYCLFFVLYMNNILFVFNALWSIILLNYSMKFNFCDNNI